jgi:hypothetical protein
MWPGSTEAAGRPRNHDVGDPRHTLQPVNAERLGGWRCLFGPDRWVEDVAEGAQHWRLVGLDVVLMGSGEPAEAILYGTI